MLRLLKNDNTGLKERISKVVMETPFKLADYQKAFELLVSGKEMKLVFDPQAQ